MTAIHLSDAGYQAIVTLAQERDITPDQLVELMVTRLIDLEAERETQEWLDDPEAMAVVRELRETRAQGTPIIGTPIEEIMRQMGITE